MSKKSDQLQMTTPAGSGLNLGDSVYERLLHERIIFLGTQVDDEIANKLCAQILLLSAEDPTRDISLYINSCLLYTSPSPRDLSTSRMPSSA